LEAQDEQPSPLHSLEAGDYSSDAVWVN